MTNRYTIHLFSIMKLAPKQSLVYDFIRNEILTKQRSPSMREIVAHFGYHSTKAASDHIVALEKKGVIEREKGKARSIRILDLPTVYADEKGIPLIGNVPAGMPEGSEQHVEQVIYMDAQTLGFPISPHVFALKIRGNSMINRGIYDGDTAIIDAEKPARNEDVVAALIDNETTLKTLIIKNNGKSYLKAENPAYSNLVPASELVIQGVARTIIRNMI
jgi:repressor LexA